MPTAPDAQQNQVVDKKRSDSIAKSQKSGKKLTSLFRRGSSKKGKESDFAQEMSPSNDQIIPGKAVE